MSIYVVPQVAWGRYPLGASDAGFAAFASGIRKDTAFLNGRSTRFGSDGCGADSLASCASSVLFGSDTGNAELSSCGSSIGVWLGRHRKRGTFLAWLEHRLVWECEARWVRKL